MYFTRSKGSETEKQSVSSNEREDLHPTSFWEHYQESFQRKVASIGCTLNPLYSNLVHAKHYHAVLVVLPSRKPGKYMEVVLKMENV